LLGFLARRVEVKESQFTMPPFVCMCSASFQRFAVMSSKAIEDVAQKGLQAREELTHQLKVYSESFKEEVSGFILHLLLMWCHNWNI
jgi:hypothetical protein